MLDDIDQEPEAWEDSGAGYPFDSPQWFLSEGERTALEGSWEFDDD